MHEEIDKINKKYNPSVDTLDEETIKLLQKSIYNNLVYYLNCQKLIDYLRKLREYNTQRVTSISKDTLNITMIVIGFVRNVAIKDKKMKII